MSKKQFDDDYVISELEGIHAEIVKSRVAMPQSVGLQDFSLLNMEALARAQSDSHEHRLLNGHTSLFNGHNGLHHR